MICKLQIDYQYDVPEKEYDDAVIKEVKAKTHDARVWIFGRYILKFWATMNDVVDGGEESMIRSQNDLYMIIPFRGAEKNVHDDNSEESNENSNKIKGKIPDSSVEIYYQKELVGDTKKLETFNEVLVEKINEI